MATAQKQTTKPVAAKKVTPAPAAQTVQTKAPVAAKVAPKTVSKPAPAAVKQAPAPAHKPTLRNLFILADIARPQSGPRLFAHTIAALRVLGMYGKGHPLAMRSAVQALIGSTAISYHTKKKGTLLEQGDSLRLSEYGASFFTGRTHDEKEVAAFEKLFTTGDGTDAKVRAAHIVPVALTI